MPTEIRSTAELPSIAVRSERIDCVDEILLYPRRRRLSRRLVQVTAPLGWLVFV
jgi:hypothetical protein